MSSFEWGSCQYDTAHEMYLEVMKMTEEELQAFLQKHGIDVNPREQKEAVTKFRTLMITHYTERGYPAEMRSRARQLLQNVDTIDDAFGFCQEMSKDLWYATDVIGRIALRLTLDRVEDTPGFGPPLNVAAQSANARTGIACALLEREGMVKDSRVFHGFDT